MARLLVGLPRLVGKIETYATKFDVVEVRPVDTPLPKPSKLARWREAVPPSFAFSVVLPASAARLQDSDELDEALDAARALQASTLLLATPAAVRPTKANRERLKELGSRLASDAYALAWAAAGIRETEDVMATAANGGWLPVFDAAQEPLPPGPIVYTRIRALGHATRLGADRIRHIAHQLAGRREATVIVEGEQAKKIRAELTAAVESLDVARRTPAVFRPRALQAGEEEQ